MREWNFLTVLIDSIVHLSSASHFVGLILRGIDPFRSLASTRETIIAFILTIILVRLVAHRRYVTASASFYIDSQKFTAWQRIWPEVLSHRDNHLSTSVVLRIFIQLQKRAPRRESVNFTVKFLGWWDTRVFKPVHWHLIFFAYVRAWSILSLSFSPVSLYVDHLFSFFFVKLLTHVSLLSCIVVVENAS